MNEFLASIRYALKKEQWLDADKAIALLDGLASAAAAAFTGLAAATAKILVQTYLNLEAAEYSALRTGASVSSIKALSYSLEQTGSSSNRAFSVIESLALRLRTQPSTEGIIRGLGVQTRINGKMRDTAEILLDVIRTLKGQNYIVAAHTASLLGISETDFYHLNQQLEKILAFSEDQKVSATKFRVDQDLGGARSIEMMRGYRALSARISLALEALVSRVAGVIQPFVERLEGWIQRNKDIIVEVVRRFLAGATVVVHWVKMSLVAIYNLSEPWAKFITSLAGDRGLAEVIKLFVTSFVAVFAMRLVAGGKPVPAALLGLATATAIAIGKARTSGAFDALGRGSYTADGPGAPAAHASGAAPLSNGARSGAAGGSGTDETSLWRRAWSATKKYLGFSSVDDNALSGGKVSRAEQADELKDPAVMARLLAMTEAEVGSQGESAQQAFMESILNRAAARKQSIMSTLQGPYFPPITHSRAAAMADDPRLTKKYADIVKRVIEGSDIAKGATGNASGSVGFGKRGFGTSTYGGENYGVEEKDLEWYREYLREKQRKLLQDRKSQERQYNPTAPIGDRSSSSMDLSVERTNRIVVQGDQDAHQTVASIAAKQRQINSDMIGSARKAIV